MMILGMKNISRSLHDFGRNKLVHYVWGLGKVSNNLVEDYTLRYVISIIKGESIKFLMILGDLMLVIKAMLAQSNPMGNKLKNLISIIKRWLPPTGKVSFLHIRRDLNPKANQWAKIVVDLNPGILLKNRELSFSSIL